MNESGSAIDDKAADTRVIRPTCRVNEFGVYAFSPDLASAVCGEKVALRDWYGEVRFTCEVVTMGRNGYPCALSYVDSNDNIREFSLYTTREIEILA